MFYSWSLIFIACPQSREMNSRTSIYKKTDEVYQLKLKASRMFFSEAVNKYGTMPFNIRGFEDENKARMGVVECLNHKLVEPFQVLYEKSGENNTLQNLC